MFFLSVNFSLNGNIGTLKKKQQKNIYHKSR